MGDNDGLILDCVSNSSQSGVGMITGPDVNTLPAVLIFNPFKRPGVHRLQTENVPFPASKQGIYTCVIRDGNNKEFTFHFGLYPRGFIGECSIEN